MTAILLVIGAYFLIDREGRQGCSLAVGCVRGLHPDSLSERAIEVAQHSLRFEKDHR